MDSKEEVSLLELGMYELTPYYQEEFDISLTEKILINQNHGRKVKHYIEKDIYFAPEQAKALEFLQEYKRCIISAPTSFGKTLILKEYIYLFKPDVVVYIVPTNALAYELENSFKTNPNFGEYTIFDRVTEESSNETDEKLLFIGTQEKYLEINEDWKNHIDLFVIDEAYKLEETVKNQRAYVLSKVFLDSVIDRVEKTVLLTPTSELEGFDEYEFNEFKSEYNAVDRVYHVIDRTQFYIELAQKSNDEKTLLFCSNPAIINNIYSEIELVDRDYNDSFITFLEEDIHPEWNVVKLLKKGILTHHGQMPKFIQNKMINMYNNNPNYNLLVGTNSISEGINTTTKNVFIHPDYDVNKHKMLIKNTIGRAGRLGVHPMGHIYSSTSLDGIEDPILIKLSISEEQEKEEVLSTLDEERIIRIANYYGLSDDFLRSLSEGYQYSLTRIEKILNVLQTNNDYSGLSNLPWMANKIFPDYYNANIDGFVIKAYFQKGYKNEEGAFSYFNSFNDRIAYIDRQWNSPEKKRIHMTFSDIIDSYMRFVYSNLEFKIMPIVNIGLAINEAYPDWAFGDYVLYDIKDCYKRYIDKNYGKLNYSTLSEGQKKIIATLKDYGMERALNELDEKKLREIESELNVRCSAFDVMQAFKRLSISSQEKDFYKNMVRYYL